MPYCPLPLKLAHETATTTYVFNPRHYRSEPSSSYQLWILGTLWFSWPVPKFGRREFQPNPPHTAANNEARLTRTELHNYFFPRTEVTRIVWLQGIRRISQAGVLVISVWGER
jgi:hypothetical protein